MANPHPAEDEALQQAGILLRFAAENAKEVPQSVVSAIAVSWEAKDTGQWTPGTSSDFWNAFHALCLLIKPASVDSLAANQPGRAPPRWQIWRTGGPAAPLAKRTARRYLVLLFICLILTIFCQFAVTTFATISEQIDKLLITSDRTAAKINQEIDSMGNVAGKGPSDKTANEVPTKAETDIEDDFTSLWFDVDKAGSKLNLLGYIASFGMNKLYQTGKLYPVTSIEASRRELLQYYTFRRDTISQKEKMSLLITIINSSLLPLILGVMGACAYVTRLVSEQIKETTFSSTSPIRHLVRIALGALVGVVVGLGWIGTGISASPLALAFISGYAVEPVFAAFDGIAEKFRPAAS